MDKLQQLIDKYNGKPCKIFPNNYSPQCFELACAYTDALGVPHYPNNPSPFPYPNAYQIYTDYGSYQSQYFYRIPNTPDDVPMRGDIVVWSGAYNGGAGHVAVATGIGDTNHFQAFEQNDPNPYCQLKDYNYNCVLGWLRYKQVTTTTPTVDDCPAKLAAITAERDKLNGVITGKDTTISNLNTTINDKNNQITKLSSDLSGAQGQVLDLTTRVNSLTEQSLKVQPLMDQVAELERQKALWIASEKNYKQQINGLQVKWDLIKQPMTKLLKKLLIDKLA